MQEYSFFPPFSLPAERGAAKACDICVAPYSLLNSEHLCKRCLRSICQQCVGSLEHPIFTHNYKESLHKICISCKNESDVIEKYIELYKLSFFANSAFAVQWARKIEIRDVKTRKKTFHGHVDEEMAARELWKSLNYSMREFVVRVCRECTKEVIEDAMRKCIRMGLLFRDYFGVGIEQTMYTIILLASHCEEDISIQIMAEIQEKYVPHISQDSIKKYIAFGCQKLQPQNPQFFCGNLNEYVQCRIAKFKLCLGVNLFPCELSICFLNGLITKSSQKEYQKGVAAALLSRRNFISNNLSRVDSVNLDLLRNCSSGEVMEIMKGLEEEREEQKGTVEGAEIQKKKREDAIKESAQLITKLKEENRLLLEKEKKYMETIRRLEDRLKRRSGYCEEEEGQEDSEAEQEQQSNDKPKQAVAKPSHPRKRHHESRASESMQQVVLQKNLRIDQLNRERDLLTLQVAQLRKQLLKQSTPQQIPTEQTPNFLISEQKAEIEDLKKQVQKMTTEKSNVMHMNELLMRKFNELSKQLVDKEQVAMTKARQEMEETAAAEGLKEQLAACGVPGENNKGSCFMF